MIRNKNSVIQDTTPFLSWLCGAVTALLMLTSAVADDTRMATVEGIVATADVAYVSDYISFAGSDAQGRVAFALDTNRGRDGDDYQAEHFVVMHDDEEGWIKIQGDGDYENKGQALAAIPDSGDFRFSGTPAAGLIVTSPTNGLTLTIDPIPERTVQGDAGRIFSMGSAPATLQWHGRTIRGRVIYELLAMANFNRLSGITLGGGFGSFQGLYLRVGENDDFYIHRRQGGEDDELLAFGVTGDATMHPRNLEFEDTDRTFAPGFYRWPTAWTVHWDAEKGPATLSVRLHDRNLIVTWILGGFAMGIVEGTLVYDGRTVPVYGLGELIM